MFPWIISILNLLMTRDQSYRNYFNLMFKKKVLAHLFTTSPWDTACQENSTLKEHLKKSTILYRRKK